MNHSVIRHMVIFNLKVEAGSPAAESFLQESRSILIQIPDVRNFEVFRQVSAKNDYDYGFSMEFAGQEEYDAYNSHPLHVEYVQSRWESEVERFLEIDFKNAAIH